MSATGYTRAFDAQADGFVPGNGAGVLVLKRLEDAVESRDVIYAVIRGSAVNNDGQDKIGYTAPSLKGERRALSDALYAADILPEEVSYVETHGTATDLGDSIEVQALKAIYDADQGEALPPCAIGSVKTNIGHTNIAAGVAALIKTVLMLYHRTMVPSLGCFKTNPNLKLESSRFYVPDTTEAWNGVQGRLVAGVSGFGIGGTNCHIVLEHYSQELCHENSADSLEVPAEERTVLLVLSAKTEDALERQKERLAKHLRSHAMGLEQVAYTLQMGRCAYAYRWTGSCTTMEEAIEKLEANQGGAAANGASGRKVVFLFPGSNDVGIEKIRRLYRQNHLFRREVDQCLPYAEARVKGIFQGDSEDKTGLFSMQLCFICNYALAKVWTALGVQPDAVMGYSLGEYMASCYAGVLSVSDALAMIEERERMILQTPEGMMLSVSASLEWLQPLCEQCGAEISAYNGDRRYMVSGSVEQIQALRAELAAQRIPHQVLPLNRAGHYAGLDGILEPLRVSWSKLSFGNMSVPVISTMYGEAVTQEELANGDYWVRQMRNPVRFQDAIQAMRGEDVLFLETGLGKQLTLLANRSRDRSKSQEVVTTIPENGANPEEEFLQAVGKVWSKGNSIDWGLLYETRPYKVPLPTYPFEDQRYWSQPKKTTAVAVEARMTLAQVYSHIADLEKEQLAQSTIKTMAEIPGLLDWYDSMCYSAIADFFRSQGLFLEEGQRIEIKALFKQLRVTEEYRAMLQFCIALLEQAGYLARNGTEIRCMRSLTVLPSLQERIDGAEEQWQAYLPYMGLLRHCSVQYAAVFSGEADGKSILYPEGRYELLMDVYRRGAALSRMDEYVEILAKAFPTFLKGARRKVRILEAGSGTGIVSWKLLEQIKDYDVEYYFTDIGRSFLTTAQKRAKELGYDFIKFQRFDVTKPPKEQPGLTGGFDYVISCNVIQATKDLEQCVSNLSELLVKDGVIIFVQTVAGHHFSQLVYGMCPEWWDYTWDPLRKNSMYPIFSSEMWKEILGRNGFDQIHSFEAAETEFTSDVALICARNTVEHQFCSEEWRQGTSDPSDERPLVGENELEQQLTAMIEDVVGETVQSPEDQLFEIGLDSLSAIILAAKIRNHYQIAFEVKELFRLDTVRSLADRLRVLLDGTAGVATVVAEKEQERQGTLEKQEKDIEDLFADLGLTEE